MRASPDPTPGRGESRLRLAALGVALVGFAAVLTWSAAAADGGGGRYARPVAVPEPTSTSSTPAAPPSTKPAPPRPDIDPYVAEPVVRLEAAPTPTRLPATPGVPLRLVVPSLGVDAPVIPIAAPDGVLLPPGDPRTLGWWRDGARPGAATGGALITGHTVHSGGGAFDDLETLRPGDAVRVRTARGVVRYAVAEVRVYRKAMLSRDAGRVFSQSVPGRLVLITCEDWNGSGYDSNAVVVAEPALH